MILEQLKALGNDTRMQMMEWLKDPLSNFPPQDHGDPAIGVCVTHLQHKARLSPSTASAHLAILQRAGFVLTTRIGKWTYYRRNEEAIDDFAARLVIELQCLNLDFVISRNWKLKGNPYEQQNYLRPTRWRL